MNYDSKKKFFGSFFCLLSSINHDYSWYYLLYITHKGSNNSYLQSFKKICVVWNNWLFLNYISYNWNLTYKKSISLPQVLEINKNYWTGSDGSTIEPSNRGLNSYHALPKIYLPIHFNFLSWTIQVYKIARFMQHFDLTQYQYHSSVSYFFLFQNSCFQMVTFPPSKLLLACILTFGTNISGPPKNVLKNSWVVWMYIQFPITRYSHIKVSMHHQA